MNPEMGEQELWQAVMDLCIPLEILWFHAYMSHRSPRGWPDLALCGKRGFILRELKNAKRKPTEEQLVWGSWLRAAGQDWDIWRPSDLHSGRILAELQAISDREVWGNQA